MNLRPEKRINKNGVAVTKHVRADSAAPGASRALPAPKLSGATDPDARPFRPSAAQTRLKKHVLQRRHFYPEGNLAESVPRLSPYAFEASDVQILDVLSVTHPSNAVFLLDQGIRTAGDARRYLAEHEAAVTDNSEVCEAALRHGTKAIDLLTYLKDNLYSDMQHPRFFDLVELSSIAGLDRYRRTLYPYVKDGSISVGDLRHLGVGRLKPHDRMRTLIAPLVTLHKDPDVPFTLNDLKMLLERTHEEDARTASLCAAVMILVNEGPEVFRHVERLADVERAYTSMQFIHDGTKRARFELEFRHTYTPNETAYYDRDMIHTLYKAGVDPFRAGEIASGGASPQAVIGIMQEGINDALGSGWL